MGNESSPGEGNAPNAFSTARKEPSPDFAICARRACVAAAAVGTGSTHWYWYIPALP